MIYRSNNFLYHQNHTLLLPNLQKQPHHEGSNRSWLQLENCFRNFSENFNLPQDPECLLAHGTSVRVLHCCRSSASRLAVSSLIPCSISSFSIALRQVTLGLPLLRFPWGVHLNGTLCIRTLESVTGVCLSVLYSKDRKTSGIVLFNDLSKDLSRLFWLSHDCACSFEA